MSASNRLPKDADGQKTRNSEPLLHMLGRQPREIVPIIFCFHVAENNEKSVFACAHFGPSRTAAGKFTGSFPAVLAAACIATM